VVVDELETIGAGSPIITVLNKIDLLPAESRDQTLAALHATFPEGVAVSACTKEGCDELARRVAAALGMHEGQASQSLPIL
jgi:50S ribosomal subunit-associated GTPase HflX